MEFKTLIYETGNVQGDLDRLEKRADGQAPEQCNTGLKNTGCSNCATHITLQRIKASPQKIERILKLFSISLLLALHNCSGG